VEYKKPPSGQNPDDGPMQTKLMNYTQMLENLDGVASSLDYASGDQSQDLLDEPGGGAPTTMGLGGNNDDELLNDLNQIFTPILIMQSFEEDKLDQIHEACSAENVLLERNVIKFDDATRMAQLISVCALLIARQKNTQQYQMYKKAAEIRNNMKLEIQKQEYSAAQALAQKFLVKVSTTGMGVARKAAQDLLPETQH
jgi:hypothetical protein